MANASEMKTLNLEILEKNKQINQYKLMVSNLNLKITALEDMKKSLITVAKILQEDNKQEKIKTWM